jgi:hypothetical protein
MIFAFCGPCCEMGFFRNLVGTQNSIIFFITISSRFTKGTLRATISDRLGTLESSRVIW